MGTWQFPIVDFGVIEGLTNPGVANFAAEPIRNLVRETLQNSLDARVTEDSHANVKFQLLTVSRADVPGLDELLCRVGAALAAHRDRIAEADSETRVDAVTLQTALDEARGSGSVQMLEVTDSGTTGLQGADLTAPNSKFDRLLFHVGTNVAAKNAGGSWGIGKHAPFAVSKLRTVFYATRTSETPRGTCLLIGKTILGRHALDGKAYSAVGYWGSDASDQRVGAVAIKSDHPLFRPDIGTSLFVLAPKVQPSTWAIRVKQAVVHSYYAAVHFEALTATVDRTIIDRNRLPTACGDVERWTAEQSGASRLHESAKFVDALPVGAMMARAKGPKYGRIEESVAGLGAVELWYRLEAQERRKSVQFEAMRHPLQVVERWNSHPGIAGHAVCIIRGDEGNDFLRRIEPVTHDSWANEADHEGRVKELKQWCKQRIADVVQSLQPAENESAGLRDFEVAQAARGERRKVIQRQVDSTVIVAPGVGKGADRKSAVQETDKVKGHGGTVQTAPSTTTIGTAAGGHAPRPVVTRIREKAPTQTGNPTPTSSRAHVRRQPPIIGPGVDSSTTVEPSTRPLPLHEVTVHARFLQGGRSPENNNTVYRLQLKATESLPAKFRVVPFDRHGKALPKEQAVRILDAQPAVPDSAGEPPMLVADTGRSGFNVLYVTLVADLPVDLLLTIDAKNWLSLGISQA